MRAVVGNVAPHLTKQEGDSKPPKIHDLFLDIGAGKRKDAERLVRVGDPITLVDEFELLRNDLAVARAFDNRIGTFPRAQIDHIDGSWSWNGIAIEGHDLKTVSRQRNAPVHAGARV